MNDELDIEKRRASDRRKRIEINRRNKEYAKKRRLYTLITLAFFAVFLVIFVFMNIKDSLALAITALVWIVIATVVLNILRRTLCACPHCNAYKGRKIHYGEFCSVCGTTLEYSKKLDKIDTEDKKE